MMKKSTFGVALAFIAAAAGVLTAVALYLRRREKELDEYERLLYSDIRAILENDRVFLLFFDDRTAYILHKDGFLTGDADEFRGFMKQRTGLQITMF